MVDLCHNKTLRSWILVYKLGPPKPIITLGHFLHLSLHAKRNNEINCKNIHCNTHKTGRSKQTTYFHVGTHFHTEFIIIQSRELISVRGKVAFLCALCTTACPLLSQKVYQRLKHSRSTHEFYPVGSDKAQLDKIIWHFLIIFGCRSSLATTAFCSGSKLRKDSPNLVMLDGVSLASLTFSKPLATAGEDGWARTALEINSIKTWAFSSSSVFCKNGATSSSNGSGGS